MVIEQALSLAEQGFPVFPLQIGSKAPATPRGYKDASRSPKVIREWWETDPARGLAVATGHGLAVLDVDTSEGHGVNGIATAAHLAKEHGNFPRTAMVKTPSGGRHLWYRADPKVRSRQAIAPGIDLKAAGGYVVVPPTPGYEWLNPISEAGLATLPDWILNLKPERKVSETLPPVIHDGEGREAALVSLAGTLRRRGLGESAILAALRGFNQEHISPPKPDTDLERISRSVAQYEAPKFVSSGKEWISKETNLPSRETLDELLKMEVPEVKTLPLLGLPGFIPEGVSTVVASYPKSGKTTLIWRCILDWLAEGRSVVYVSEEVQSTWLQRVHGLLDIKRTTEQGPFNLIRGRGFTPEDLFKAAFDHDEEIVVVDTLRSILQFTQETDNSVIARQVTPWVTRAEATGKTFIGLHHETKLGGDDGRGVAGGHALLGVFDHLVEVKRRKGNVNPYHREVSTLGRLTHPIPIVYTLEKGDLVVVGNSDQVSKAQVRERVVEAVILNPRTFEEIKEAIPSPRPADTAIRETLKLLTTEETIGRSGNGNKGSPYRWHRIVTPGAPAEHWDHLLNEDDDLSTEPEEDVSLEELLKDG